MQVRPDQDEHRDRPQPTGVGAAVDDEEQGDGEDRHAQELRPERQGHRGDPERHHGQGGGAARAETAPPGDREDAPEDDADERRAKQDQTRPAADPVDRGEDDLGTPLLVDPRGTGRRIRPGIGAGQRSAGQDLVARAEVISEIHR